MGLKKLFARKNEIEEKLEERQDEVQYLVNQSNLLKEEIGEAGDSFIPELLERLGSVDYRYVQPAKKDSRTNRIAVELQRPVREIFDWFPDDYFNYRTGKLAPEQVEVNIRSSSASSRDIVLVGFGGHLDPEAVVDELHLFLEKHGITLDLKDRAARRAVNTSKFVSEYVLNRTNTPA